MNILEMLSSFKEGYQGATEPLTRNMAEFFGDTKTMIDEGGDGTQYQVVDNDAFNRRMKNMAEVSASLAKMPAPPSGAMRPQQVYSSPAPVMGAAPNPYAPVNYSQMRYQSPTGPALVNLGMMRGQSPTGSAISDLEMMRMQSPTGGIGSSPNLEQILKALQSRGL